ncbi:MAG TPA: Lrp/AsnC family transcriptional regulator [Bacillales bacterium]|nr:Lrp/AsnC family transcriptional regulator [Bacillales bacterium]
MTGILDELDKGIVKLLAKDGRMSFTEIAEQLNVTEKTIRSRYKNLTHQGILKVTGVVNPVSVGVKVVALLQIAVNSGAFSDVRERLVGFPRVRFVTMTSGEYQFLIQVHQKTYDQLTEFLKELNKITGIARTNTIIQFEVYKNTFDYL